MATNTATMDAVRVPREEQAIWKPRYNPWLIAITVTLATFMEVLDTSIANVALPHIAGSLSASQDEATWVLTSYLVSNAIVLPLSGWLSSCFGRKRFYMTCVLSSPSAPSLCGLAPTLRMLVFFRVLQGAGGGGLQPSEQAILADTFPPQKRGMAFAIYGIGGGRRRPPSAPRWAAGSPTTILALDLLHQHPRRDPVTVSHQLHGGGPALLL